MATNLLENVCSALPKEPLKFAWLNSTVALHWIMGKGSYRQFVTNRVTKIQAHSSISWRHVPTKGNLADIVSRGGLVSSFWWSGQEWLQEPARWPVTQPSAESNAEAKIVCEVVCLAKSTQPEKDEFDSLFKRSTLCRTLRVLAWVKRFIANSRRHEKRSGPLDTEETETVKIWWIERI